MRSRIRKPGQIKTIKRIPMGLLGAELSRDKSGYYRIDKIIPEPSTAARYAHRLPNRNRGGRRRLHRSYRRRAHHRNRQHLHPAHRQSQRAHRAHRKLYTVGEGSPQNRSGADSRRRAALSLQLGTEQHQESGESHQRTRRLHLCSRHGS